MNGDLSIYVENHFQSRSMSVYIYQRTPEGFFLARPIILERVADNMEAPEPTMSISSRLLTEFMDELWRAGVRPSQDIYGSHEAMGIMKNHLEDMRRIVFEKGQTT